MEAVLAMRTILARGKSTYVVVPESNQDRRRADFRRDRHRGALGMAFHEYTVFGKGDFRAHIKVVLRSAGGGKSGLERRWYIPQFHVPTQPTSVSDKIANGRQQR